MSEGNSFFPFVLTLALATGVSVYAIKHRDQVTKLAHGTMSNMATRMQVPTDADANVQAAKSSGEIGDVELKANDSGHFETEAEVNGSRVDVMVDTGATLVALTYDDAQRAGIYLKPSDFTYEVKTANGVAKIASVNLSSITIGDITVHDVRGAVSERGKLHKTLLGMSFLSRLSRVEMRANALVLHE